MPTSTIANSKMRIQLRQVATNAMRPIVATKLDHICIVAKDINASIMWYNTVLGMKHVYTNAQNFYPTCSHSPAFLQNGHAKIAIAPLSAIKENSVFKTRQQFGEHFALTVSRNEFTRAEVDLPLLLKKNSPCSYVIDIEACDYGHQLSLFFHDLDTNVVELTTWVDPESKDRLS
jgi:catechol 2,3-dioxygenase-like lactoylglutathione lyase family enzyme